MKWAVIATMLMVGLTLEVAPSRAEVGQGFGFRGLVLEVALDRGQVLINETWLRITENTEVFNLQGDPEKPRILKVGDRVRVVAEHQSGYDEALQIILVAKKKPRKTNE